jgi:cobalt/nickel transport system permease protein
MHILDNYLSPATCAVMTAAMIPVWTVSIRKVKRDLPSSKIPLLGIGAAFTFLVMMFNIPVPGGTTAHAIGGTLIAALLGPWAACIAVSVAVLIQALLFGDGGILAYGANCFNMAFVIPFLGYFIFTFFRERVLGDRGELISLGVASYLAIVASALCVAIEFGLQPVLAKDAVGLPLYCPYPLAVSVPAMLIPHMTVAGFVEAFFTVGVFGFIKRVSPSTVYEGSEKRIHVVYGVLVALACLSPLGLLASGTAWGEWRLEQLKTMTVGGPGLASMPSRMVQGVHLNVAFPDYAVAGVSPLFGYVLSAVAGGAFLIVVFKLLGLMRKQGTVKT